MKKLELNQMENLEGGAWGTCHDIVASVMGASTVLMFAGPVGFGLGGTIACLSMLAMPACGKP